MDRIAIDFLREALPQILPLYSGFTLRKHVKRSIGAKLDLDDMSVLKSDALAVSN